MNRAHISLRTKLASALLALGHIPYDEAKLLSEDQVLSLYQWDHGILHSIEANDAFWNLTPRLIAEHRAKSRKDTTAVAKVKRLSRATAEAQSRLLAKSAGNLVWAPKSKWPKGRKIASRNTFQKRGQRSYRR